MGFDYQATVIVPNYNMSEFLDKSIQSLLNQTIDPEKMEILLIDDGSTDNSVEIMRKYEAKYSCIKVIAKENEGPSETRNHGIRRAKGKYIFYLDADDMLSPETLKDVTDFFDKHYDEIDLVSYKEVRKKDGMVLAPHYRYQTLIRSGVYDLNKIENAFITQTFVNVCVKNLLEENVLFDPDMKCHENQQYCFAVLRRKMKLGFCSKGEYIYMQQSNSTVGKYSYAYYIFEGTMRMWEEAFSYYNGGHVPYYIQAAFIHDVGWKTQSDKLLPYHYSPEKLEEARQRILRLVNQVEDEVILRHPSLDYYHRHYFINMKTNNELKALFGPDAAVITNHDLVVYELRKVAIELRDFKVYKDKVRILAYIKEPIFSYLKKPRLFLYKNGDSFSREEVELNFSAWSYYKAKTVTNNFYRFDITIDTSDLKSFEFKVYINGRMYDCRYIFMPRLYFNHRAKRYALYGEGKRYRFNNAESVFYVSDIDPNKFKKWLKRVRGEYRSSDKKAWLFRNICTYKIAAFENVWLYYDCKGVDKDNAYYQFDYDFAQKDGVSRYYILNEEDFAERRKKYPANQRKHIVKFGSVFHKFLYLKARRIITAYVEYYNHYPFDNKTFRKYMEVNNQKELIYLQHGVLHAHMPWKYSMERLGIDREVISTPYERDNLMNNYGFKDSALIPCGMPRYDYIDENQEPVNRILFAPSWRKYLIGELQGVWEATDESFLQSKYYRETMEFLNSPRLQELLEKNDLYLDFKLHPIFQCYKRLYSITNSRVSLAENSITETRYKIFITDFSSFVFDFVYLQRPIIYFVPDKEMFDAGMASYRELDIPFDNAFGELVCDSKMAIDEVEKILNNRCKPGEKYQKRMENFFYYKDNHQRERLYRALMDDVK